LAQAQRLACKGKMVDRSTSSVCLEWLSAGAYKNAWKAVIRPSRCIYSLSELGPSEFSIGGRAFKREDFRLKSASGHNLECSHFSLAEPSEDDLGQQDSRPPRPCVLYLHGCSSSRLEVLDVLHKLLPHQLDVFCMDFAGSGLSGGDYVSLGHYEEKDLGVAIRHLRKSGRVTSIGLWGRSMGASTAILRASKDRCLSACVLDSPFRDLRSIATDMVTQSVPVPQWVIDIGVEAVRTEVLSRAGFDPGEVLPIRSARRARCPGLFAAASDDSFVLPQHAQDLHDAWGGHRAIRSFEGGHNGDRPEWFLDEAARFLTLQLYHEAGDRKALPLLAELSLHAPDREAEGEPVSLQASSLSAESSLLSTAASPEAEKSHSGEAFSLLAESSLPAPPALQEATEPRSAEASSLLAECSLPDRPAPQEASETHSAEASSLLAESALLAPPAAHQASSHPAETSVPARPAPREAGEPPPAETVSSLPAESSLVPPPALQEARGSDSVEASSLPAESSLLAPPALQEEREPDSAEASSLLAKPSLPASAAPQEVGQAASAQAWLLPPIEQLLHTCGLEVEEDEEESSDLLDLSVASCLPVPLAARGTALVKKTFRRAGAFLGVSRRRPQRRARSSGWRRGHLGSGGDAADGDHGEDSLCFITKTRSKSL